MSETTKPCVWIVEDSAMETEAAKRALGPGFETVSFVDGPSMLERLSQSGPPDVVLLDWHLPALSGIEICQFLRSATPPHDVGILIVTGVYSKTQDLVQGFAAGANDYVVKPYVPEELAARVSALVRTKQLRERATRAERTLRTALQELPDPLIAVDAQQRVRFVNREASRLLGADGDAVGKLLHEVAPPLARLAAPETRPDSIELCDRIFAPVMRELALDDRGPLTFITLRDITDTKRQLNARDQFLAMLAHELRNPLAPIRTALEVLKLQPHPTAAQRPREIMERQVSRMVRLVDDLLDISRLTRGQIELTREAVDIAATLRRAIEDTQPLLDAQNHELVLDVDDAALTVQGDPVRLEQIFSNLLNNAAKYTPSQGRLRVEARRHGADIVVRVIDNGIGIDAALQPRVFDMFVQAETGLARTRGGLGIGLTLVKQLARLHGGDVDVESGGAGQGSAFTVRLPASDAPVVQAETAPVAHAGAAAPLRVLVVDDNEDAAELLASALVTQGHAVEVAGSGAEALERARVFRPRVILLDIGLPGIDGYGVAKQLRAESQLSDCVIIGVTGYGQPDDRRRASEAGFDEHLVKPIELDHLWSVIAVHTA